MVARGLAPSRQKARDIILNSSVLVDGKPIKKVGELIRTEALISLDTDILDYVSRGGLKLATALDHFKEVEIAGKICLDLGASTGGFTDVLLQRGAAFIYAVDVGHSQLAETIRKNPKVCNLEKTNARQLDKNIIDIPPSIIVCDVSFISLQVALPAALALASEKADLLVLVKSQFEVGRAFIGKGGVVRDKNARKLAEISILGFLKEQGWRIRGTCPSPIRGSDGNQETIVAAFR